MLILPTKRLPIDRSLMVVGAEILELIQEPITVSRLWYELVKKREKSEQTLVTFDWFVLALDFLYALKCIRFEQGVLSKQQVISE